MSCRKKRASWRKGGACRNDANNSDGECPYSAGSGRVPKRYDGLVKRYNEAKARYDGVTAAISAKEAKSERLANFIKALKAQNGTISDFDCSLWGGMVEFVTVGRNKEITVTFRDGSEIQG